MAQQLGLSFDPRDGGPMWDVPAEPPRAEEWRPIDGWPYEVSSYGRVRRVIRYRNSAPDGIVQGTPGSGGYLRVTLSSQNRRASVRVHQLVAIAFIGPKPSSAHEVAHSDGRCANNAATNLRWATREENERDKARHGTKLIGEQVHGAKCTAEIIRKIRDAAGTIYDIAPRFGIHPATVDRIRRRATWKHVA